MLAGSFTAFAPAGLSARCSYNCVACPHIFRYPGTQSPQSLQVPFLLVERKPLTNQSRGESTSDRMTEGPAKMSDLSTCLSLAISFAFEVLVASL